MKIASERAVHIFTEGDEEHLFVNKNYLGENIRSAVLRL